MKRKPNRQRSNQKKDRNAAKVSKHHDPKFGLKSALAFNLINQRKRINMENTNEQSQQQPTN